MQNDYQNDVPIEELRYKYLRKHPLSEPTPVTATNSSDSGTGQSTIQYQVKRTPARLVADILLFVSFMIFSIIIAVSFAGTETQTFGIFGFISEIGDSFEALAKSLLEIAEHNPSYLESIMTPSFFLGIITMLLVLITSVVLVITTFVCMILAIVQFSKKNSRNLTNVVIYHAITTLGTYMTFALINLPNITTYKLSPAIGISIGFIALIAIGSAIALFVKNKPSSIRVRNQWISNMIYVGISGIAIIILANAKLGTIISTLSSFLFNQSSTNNSNFNSALLLFVVSGFLYTAVFSTLTGGVSNALKFLATYGENDVNIKIKSFNPLKTAITATVISGISIVASIISSNMLKTDILAQDHETLLIIGTVLIIGTIVSSAILNKISKNSDIINQASQTDNSSNQNSNENKDEVVDELASDEEETTENTIIAEEAFSESKEPIKMPTPTKEPIKIIMPKKEQAPAVPVEAVSDAQSEAPAPTPKPKIVIKIVKPKNKE